MSRQRKVVLNPVKFDADQVQVISSALQSIPLEDRMSGYLISSAESRFGLAPRSSVHTVSSKNTEKTTKPLASEFNMDFSPSVPEKKKPVLQEPPKKEEPVKQKEKDLNDWLDDLLG